jgi:hypothetical protein
VESGANPVADNVLTFERLFERGLTADGML